MKSRYVKMILKVISFVLCFVIIFAALQEVYISVVCDYPAAIRGFYSLTENSIDVLFLGSSQMFNTVDSQKITEEYGIPSYSFGASGQQPKMTLYYLQEALKRQKPKIIMVEVSRIFKESSGTTDQVIAWSYAATPLSIEKIKSLVAISDGDVFKALKYCVPLIAYHSMWSQMNPVLQVIKVLKDPYDYSARGFVSLPSVKKVDLAYTQEGDGDAYPYREEALAAIIEIAKQCNENGIKVAFFKAPCATWTRSDSKVTKKFMEENGLLYFEMNDYLDEIGIDPETDFRNENHLNSSGAEKTTDFLVKYLLDMIGT